MLWAGAGLVFLGSHFGDSMVLEVPAAVFNSSPMGSDGLRWRVVQPHLIPNFAPINDQILFEAALGKSAPLSPCCFKQTMRRSEMHCLFVCAQAMVPCDLQGPHFALLLVRQTSPSRAVHACRCSHTECSLLTTT